MNAEFGNMTSVEKKLNRNDLLAYKNYDNTQYAIIPGYSPNAYASKIK